jgi:serine/threonine protein kinase
MDLVPGLLVDQYRLEANVGNGASGEVWRASDGKQVVALKFINKRLLEGDNANIHRGRFRDEVRTLEDLARVPNVPQLYGYNIQTIRPYLAMTYIDSPPWSEMIHNGQMLRVPLLERLNLLETLAHTLNRIHQIGYIHRDVKPANLHGTDPLYLIDFSVTVARASLAEVEHHIGTGVYMPPLDDKPLDESFDYFAFSLVAYEVLFGFHAVFSPAFIPSTLEETRTQMGQQLTARAWHWPSQLTGARLPGSLRGANLVALDRIFDRALGSREVRYTDLIEFITKLRGAILVPSNAPYIDYVPAEGGNANGVPEEMDYTEHQVRKARQQTQHPPPIVAPVINPRRRRRGLWWTALLAVLGFLAILFFLFSLRTP